MIKKIGTMILILVMVFIGSLTYLNGRDALVIGPKYPNMISYDGNRAEDQLVILDQTFSLPSMIVELVETTTFWKDLLGRFLAGLEEIVKKYGRQAKEMLRYLPDKKIMMMEQQSY